jgi:uncharacterized protein (TIGR02996 family)
LNPDESAFLDSIRAEPKDDLRRLVFADWLEEQSSDECRTKAEYLRLEVHVSGLPDDHPERDGFILKLRGVAEGLPIDWKSTVAKVAIENCNVRWRFQCPKKWSELEQVVGTGVMDVRFCTACRQYVTYCNSVEEARQRAESTGGCVAIDRSALRQPLDMAMLRSPPELDSDIEMGEFAVDDFNPGVMGHFPPPPGPPGPSFLRRLWRKLTGK